MQIFFVLLLIIIIFTALRPDAFLSVNNFRNIATERVDPVDSRDGHDRS
jgi:ribose/xylose/arabinose/galactoside ABC-type transport system permease subunit